MAFKGLIPGWFPTKEMARSRVMEIAPDIWEVEGYLSTQFFLKPPSCNCFVLRDKDLVLLVDTGTYAFYRQPILDILARYKKDGAKRLVLMLTQGHFDHVANNDLILEAGYDDVRFLLPEAEVSTIDLWGHWTGEFLELSEYYDPYCQMPMAFPTAVPNLAGHISPALAQRLIEKNLRHMFRGIHTLADRAEILTNDSRISRTFGDVTFQGWEIGRFFAVHDATHSPGHLSFYDPEHKVFLTGDATLEINPAFFNSSLNTCIDMMDKFARFAEQGFVELATDAHRSVIWAERLADELKYSAADPIQEVDALEGRDKCVTFYRFFEEYYTVMKETVLSDLARMGSATVPQLVEEFKGSTHPYARFKVAAKFPRLPSRLDVMVANILKEADIPARREGTDILFSPQET